MAASLFDSPNYAKLFPVGDAGRLFTDTAEVRAMMLVEGTLAKLQGKAGIIFAKLDWGRLWFDGLCTQV